MMKTYYYGLYSSPLFSDHYVIARKTWFGHNVIMRFTKRQKDKMLDAVSQLKSAGHILIHKN